MWGQQRLISSLWMLDKYGHWSFSFFFSPKWCILFIFLNFLSPPPTPRQCRILTFVYSGIEKVFNLNERGKPLFASELVYLDSKNIFIFGQKQSEPFFIFHSLYALGKYEFYSSDYCWHFKKFQSTNNHHPIQKTPLNHY